MRIALCVLVPHLTSEKVQGRCKAPKALQMYVRLHLQCEILVKIIREI